MIFVAVAGWGLDKLWQYFSPPPTVTSPQHDLLTLIEQQLNQHAPTKNIKATLASRFELLTLDDFARSSLSAELSTGEPILLHTKNGQLQLYKCVNCNSATTVSPQVIRLTFPKTQRPKNSYLYEILLTLFYGSIGLVVFIWVWPLMRDVRKLEQHTQHIGKHGLPDPVSVLPGSAVGNLARAFNQMAERIKELLASHKEMTYAVSHELRTPLARMKFALAMAGETEQKNNVHLQGLAQDVDEMDALITQLLTYAGYEQESGPLKQAQGDMAFLISELITRAKKSHPSNAGSIIFDFTCAPDAHTVTCDWHLMERAIFNLIHNAMRFSQGRININLSRDATHYQITVADDGPGIPPEDRLRVFDSFTRLESQPNAQTRGFGLGLAIVQRVLKWHQGEASVRESEELGGALFLVRWPVA